MIFLTITHVKTTEDNKYMALGLRRDTDVLHLYVKEIRILTPAEYQRIRAVIPMDRHKTLLDILLITGARYVEIQRLYDNHVWYNENRNLIHLSESAQKKAKRKQLERTI